MLTEPRLIRFRDRRAGARRGTGTASRFGLASGFVEPLESTSIHLIMIGVTRLMQLFPFGGVSEALVERYNELSRTELEGIRDFIILHYKLTERDDSPFWRRCREMEIPDIAGRAHRAVPRQARRPIRRRDELFRVDSWVQVMLGQRLEPAAPSSDGPADAAGAAAPGARRPQEQYRQAR